MCFIVSSVIGSFVFACFSMMSIAAGWLFASKYSFMVFPFIVSPFIALAVSPSVSVFPSIALLEWMYSILLCLCICCSRSGWSGL